MYKPGAQYNVALVFGMYHLWAENHLICLRWRNIQLLQCTAQRRFRRAYLGIITLHNHMLALPGEETTVYLPWREFVPVKRARVDPEAPELDPARVRQLGIVLSRFEFNGAANPNYRAGPFELKARLVVLLHAGCQGACMPGYAWTLFGDGKHEQVQKGFASPHGSR